MRAIKVYEENWHTVLNQWREHSMEYKIEKPMTNVKYDLCKFVRFAVEHEGLTDSSEIKTALDLPDVTKINEILQLAYEKKWLELAYPTDDSSQNGTLTDEQVARFKPRGGKMGRVYRVTNLGKEEVTQ